MRRFGCWNDRPPSQRAFGLTSNLSLLINERSVEIFSLFFSNNLSKRVRIHLGDHEIWAKHFILSKCTK